MNPGRPSVRARDDEVDTGVLKELSRELAVCLDIRRNQ